MEVCPAKLETAVNEPLSDLKSDRCSERLEAEPSEPLKALKSEVRSTNRAGQRPRQ